MTTLMKTRSFLLVKTSKWRAPISFRTSSSSLYRCFGLCLAGVKQLSATKTLLKTDPADFNPSILLFSSLFSQVRCPWESPRAQDQRLRPLQVRTKFLLPLYVSQLEQQVGLLVVLLDGLLAFHGNLVPICNFPCLLRNQPHQCLLSLCCVSPAYSSPFPGTGYPTFSSSFFASGVFLVGFRNLSPLTWSWNLLLQTWCESAWAAGKCFLPSTPCAMCPSTDRSFSACPLLPHNACMVCSLHEYVGLCLKILTLHAVLLHFACLVIYIFMFTNANTSSDSFQGWETLSPRTITDSSEGRLLNC